MSDASVVSVDCVSRTFGEFRALDNASLKIHAGQTHVLLGHNGAGKTTLIRILLGLIRPTDGTVTVHGQDAWQAREGRVAREQTGVLFEPNALYDDLTAIENLEFFARIYRLDLPEWRERVLKLLDSLGLLDRKHDRISKWSAGMKRKLAIIRAIQHQPDLVVLDEPSAGLDIQARAGIRDAINKIRSENMAILIASQDLAEVQRIATHATLLRKGKVLYTGTMYEFCNQAALRRFHGSAEAVSKFSESLPSDMELVREEVDTLGVAVVVRVSDPASAQNASFSGLAETPVLLEDIYMEMEQQN